MGRKILFAGLIGLVTAGVLSVLFLLGVFSSWQGRLSDALFVARPAVTEIVIIAIDDTSIGAIGRWPWKRSVHADLINKLQVPGGGPRVIGLDISFFEASEPAEDQRFAEALAAAGNVVLAGEEVDGKLILPLYLFSRNAKVGVVNTVADGDGITRRAKVNFGEYTHFTTAILGKEPEVTEKGYLRINFAGPPESFKTYSYIDILNGKANPAEFSDKIVLVGATAPDLHDEQMVPTSGGVPMSGVEIHANAMATISESKYLRVAATSETMLVILAGALLMSLAVVLAPIGWSLVVLMVAAIAHLAWAFLAFDAGKIVNLLYPILALALVYIVGIVYKYFSEFNQKRFIKKAFSFYLSPAVLQELLSHPAKLKLGGERKNLTVLFSDIEGFTSISEKMAPERLSEFLNEYLTGMTEIIFRHKGVLDKYIGDAIMAFWGAPLTDPQHALNACRAALAMSEFTKKGKFRTRIGINSGEMVVGNMGSKQRFDYTLLGDNVNLGSRLEGINKEYGTNIIISESVYKKVSKEVVARKLDKVAVKGKSRPVTIYELRGVGAPNPSEEEFLAEFEEGRRLYESGKFAKARANFVILGKKYPTDGPAKTYLTRIQSLGKDPVKTWDGVYRAKTK